jgi:hypothetical protein
MDIKKRLFRLIKRWRNVPDKFDKIQETLGRIENRQIEKLLPSQINDAEFKVYSQWGEDGIIQHLLRHVPIGNRTFVEFGVENYTESNTRFLLVNNNWAGLVLDGSDDNIEYIKNDMHVFYEHDLKAESVFITRDNINDVILRNGINGDIGLLSVDIDGNDYWIWDAITCISPRIVICEYNSHFGANPKVSTPYVSTFYRGDAHYSNIYYGASISALTYLASKKGYSLVGGNSAGNNVFFVRNDVCSSLKIISPEEAYQKANFKEAKDRNGRLNYLDFNARLKEILNLDVVNVESNKLIKISETIM